MKKVIFVGGTSFSGSTFFHLMLANDPTGFACGEIRSLFNPEKPHHARPVCGCGDKSCDLWYRVRKHGEERVYQTIFELYPGVEYIVDSSKNVFWIHSQTERLRKNGIDTANILIWKTPLEFASSNKKRKRLEGWDSQWINYHRLYMTLIRDWRTISYCDLTSQPEMLAMACDHVAIPYFAGKECFWEKEHHSLGGNYTAKFHLYNPQSAQEQLKQTFDANRMNLYRRIYYTPIEDPALENLVNQRMGADEYFQPILNLLETHDVANQALQSLDVDNTLESVRLSQLNVQFRKLKQRAKTSIGRRKYRAHSAA